MSQKPRPLVPAIQTPPPAPPAPSVELASGASAVTRPSSAGLRNSVHRPRTGSRTLPTHTPSGAGAGAAAPSSANSLTLEPGASTRTTPRSHASQSDRPRAISRLPSTQGNPSVPVPSIVVSADRSRATHFNPRRSPTRPADATHTPPGAAATAPARVAISPNLSGFHSPVAGSTRTRPAPSEPKNSSLLSGERAAAVKR